MHDLLLIGNFKTLIDQFKGEFRKRYEIKDLGPAALMLGIHIKHCRQNKTSSISHTTIQNTSSSVSESINVNLRALEWARISLSP